MNDPHIWWYVTRTSAIIAWVLMTFSVLWGVLLATRILRKVDDAGRLQDVHRYLGGLSLFMILLHMVSLMLDRWLHLSLTEVLVPFESGYRPFAVALGIVAFYVLVAVYGSSLIRDRLPKRFWKGLHYVSYLAVLLVSMHAGLSGTDSGRWWYLSVATALIALTAAAVIVRILLTDQPAPVVAAVTDQPATVVSPVADRVAASVVDAEPRVEAVVRMVVVAIEELADGVRGLRLLTLGGGDVVTWDPGAHLTVELPGGMTRQYSLCGDPADRDHYEIAVLRDEHSRGGSAWLHEGLRLGMTLDVWSPRNHFPLVPAARYLLIAGGIGITPLRAMIDAMPAGADWRLVYLGRSRTTMAYLTDLMVRHPDRVLVYARDEHDGRLDLGPVVRQWASVDTEVYVCGPEGMIEAVREATDPARFHTEHFVPVERADVPPARALQVDCVRSGIEVVVPADQSVLEALEENDVTLLASCRRGVCGSCEVRVLAGVPEHLDSVLDDAEKTELGIMFPCVSRGVGDRLVLDV